jgi:mRNA-degrading endonuclease toxin of MazEF toxin-antitoxin module
LARDKNRFDLIRAIDNQRIISDKLAKLSWQKVFEIDEQIKIVLGLE